MRRAITAHFQYVVFACMSTLLFSACTDDALTDVSDGAPCVSDDDCLRSQQRCVIGTCVQMANGMLGSVDLDVSPFNMDAAPQQQFLGVFSDDSDARVQVQMREESQVAGRVLDASQQALAAHVVALPAQVIPGRALSLSTSSSEENGEFELRLLKGEAYRFIVYPNDETLAPIYLDTPFIPSNSSVVLEDFVLPAPETQVLVQGRVTAGAGAETLGIPGLKVRFLHRERRASSTAITDSNGQFSVRITQLGKELTLEVSPTEANLSFPSLKVAGHVINEDSTLDDVDLGATLYTPVPVSGQVVGPDGNEVSEALVFISAEFGAGILQQEVRADATGNFALSLPPGEYRFAAVAPNTSKEAGMIASITQTVALNQDPLRLIVAPRVPFSGTLLNQSQQPVARSWVRLVRLSGPTGAIEDVLHAKTWEFTTRTQEDGSFNLRVDPGRYRLSFAPEAATLLPQHTQIVDVFTDASDETYQLPAAGFLSGILVATDGSPRTDLEGSLVRAFAPFASENGKSQGLGEATVDEQGAFTLILPELFSGEAETPRRQR